MLLLFSVQPPKQLAPGVFDCLRYILLVSQQLQQSRRQQQQQAAALLLQQQQQQQRKQRNSSATSETEPVADSGVGVTSAEAADVELPTKKDTEETDELSSRLSPSTSNDENERTNICHRDDPPSANTSVSNAPTDNVAAKTVPAKGLRGTIFFFICMLVL